MRRIFRIRVFIVILLAAGVAAIVATAMNQKQRLEAMDAAARRDYLGNMLGGRVSDEQIDRIAAAISEKLDAGKPLQEATEAVEAAAEKVAEAAEEAAEAVEEAAEEAVEEGGN